MNKLVDFASFLLVLSAAAFIASLVLRVWGVI